MGKLASFIARDIASPAVKMGNRSLFPGVAVPRAFFGTFFRFERKYVPLQGGSPTVRAGVGASISPEGYAPKGLSTRLFETFGHQIWPETNENCIYCALGIVNQPHVLDSPEEPYGGILED